VRTLSKCKVNVTWSAPRDNGCPLNKYTIHYREIQLTKEDTPLWHETSITNVAQTFSGLSLKCNRQYELTVTASNDAGKSDKAHKLRINITGTSRVLIKCYLTRTISWRVHSGCQGRLGSQRARRLKVGSVPDPEPAVISESSVKRWQRCPIFGLTKPRGERHNIQNNFLGDNHYVPY